MSTSRQQAPNKPMQTDGGFAATVDFSMEKAAQHEKVSYDRALIVEVSRNLQQIVVSLDRIGSHEPIPRSRRGES